MQRLSWKLPEIYYSLNHICMAIHSHWNPQQGQHTEKPEEKTQRMQWLGSTSDTVRATESQTTKGLHCVGKAATWSFNKSCTVDKLKKFQVNLQINLPAIMAIIT